MAGRHHAPKPQGLPFKRVPTPVFLFLLMAFATLPPIALLKMQREARRPVPYLTIDLQSAEAETPIGRGDQVLPLDGGS
ncbi:MAG: hypothetical protein AAGH41_05595 [Pseudomonadota bacterium]